MKPYAKLALTEPQFQLARSSVSAQQIIAHDKVSKTIGAERKFYEDMVVRFDELLALFEVILINDTSQDPEEFEEED